MGRINEGSAAAAPRPTQPPSPLRRVITGILGLFLVGGGAYLLAISIIGLGDCSAWGCRVHILTSAFGSALVVAGGLFAFAAVVPFGGYRRVLIGLGGGLLAGATFGLAYAGPATVVPAVGLGAAAAIAVSYVGYRLAR
jgi:hypothetical protein